MAEKCCSNVVSIADYLFDKIFSRGAAQHCFTGWGATLFTLVNNLDQVVYVFLGK